MVSKLTKAQTVTKSPLHSYGTTPFIVHVYQLAEKNSPALQLPGDSPQQIPAQKVHPFLYKHMYKSVQYYRPFSLSLFLSLMNMWKSFVFLSDISEQYW